MKDLWPDNNVMIRLDLETAVIPAISHGWQHIFAISLRSVPIVSQYHVEIIFIIDSCVVVLSTGQRDWFCCHILTYLTELSSVV